MASNDGRPKAKPPLRLTRFPMNGARDLVGGFFVLTIYEVRRSRPLNGADHDHTTSSQQP